MSLFQSATADEDAPRELVRMRKDDHLHHVHHQYSHPVTDVHPTSDTPSSSSNLQFFIRMVISSSNTIVVQANSEDTVKSLHERIYLKTGIPVIEQRLIYRGKQLQWERSLADCAIENDTGLQLVGRMLPTSHPEARRLMDNMISLICRLCRGAAISSPAGRIKGCLNKFFECITRIPAKDNSEMADAYLQIFMASSAPAALVMLYMSPINSNKQCAGCSISHILSLCKRASKQVHSYFATIVFEFCKLLRKVANEDRLYAASRNALGFLLESTRISKGLVKGKIVLQEIFPFVSELAAKLSTDLDSELDSGSGEPLASDVRDFASFVNSMRFAIMEQVGFQIPISVDWEKKDYGQPSHGKEIEFLHAIFNDLLAKMEKCLLKMEESIAASGIREGELFLHSGWSQNLAILKELNGISKLYQGAEEQFWMVLRNRKSSLCALIIRFANQNGDYQWLLEHKDVTSFEARRHLATMMFSEVK